MYTYIREQRRLSETTDAREKREKQDGIERETICICAGAMHTWGKEGGNKVYSDRVDRKRGRDRRRRKVFSSLFGFLCARAFLPAGCGFWGIGLEFSYIKA